jgi:DNA-binding LytR/AlgR family response regulator
MIRAIALDDEPPALELLKRYCANAGNIQLQKCFTRPVEAASYLAQYPVDVIFLDIDMPGTSGMQFLQQVPAGTMVVFATAHSAYAAAAFDCTALDYLLKPFGYERFLQTIQKAIVARHKQLNAPQQQQNIALRVNYALVKLPLANIMYIEGLDDYLRIVLQDQKPAITRMTMKAMEEKLPENGFTRVHRSYIIPVNKIDFVRNKTVYIDKYRIPIGVCYEEKFYNTIKRSCEPASAGE